MDMGERIKELRTKKGVTQEELGKVIGVTKATIMKYEKGMVENLKRSSIEKLANYLDVTPSYLMCLENVEQKEKMNDFRFASHNGINIDGLDENDIEEITRFVEFIRNKKKNEK